MIRELLHEAGQHLPLIAAPFVVLVVRTAFGWTGGPTGYAQRATFGAPREQTFRTLSDVVLELGGRIGRAEPSAGLLWFTSPAGGAAEVRFAATVLEPGSGACEVALDGHAAARGVGALINPRPRVSPDPAAAIVARMREALPAAPGGPGADG